jgi:hypothetical protein
MAGGRPKLSSSIRRRRVVHVRLSDEEWSALTSFASAHRLTTSEILRRLARQASGFGPTFDGEAAKGIRANVGQLRKAGVNLNQIARALNAGRAPGYAELKGGVDRLGRLVMEQMGMLEAMCGKGRARASEEVTRDV